MEEQFDWANDDAVVVKPVQAIAVYTNEKGDVVLRQEADGHLFQDDPFVVIPLIDLDNVIERLSKIRHELYE